MEQIEQIKEYLYSNDLDLASIGFELLRGLNIPFRKKKKLFPSGKNISAKDTIFYKDEPDSVMDKGGVWFDTFSPYSSGKQRFIYLGRLDNE